MFMTVFGRVEKERSRLNRYLRRRKRISISDVWKSLKVKILELLKHLHTVHVPCQNLEHSY